MKKLTLASCVALLVLVPVVVHGQSRTPPAGATSVGSASPRGGESSTSSSGSSNSSAGERSGGSSGSGSGYSGESPANTSSGRYSGARSGEASAVARPRSGGANVGQPVPASERPRGDRPTYGQAAPRGTVKPPQTNVGTGGGYYYPNDYGYNGYYGGYYDPYGFGYLGPYYYGNYNYGLWNAWYTNTWLGPYGSSISPMYAWGLYDLPISAYAGMWSDFYAQENPSYVESVNGSIKLKVKPKTAEVYVDGTFYGQVDHYDGAFQHLDLKAGTHRVTIRAEGYQPLEFQLRVLPGRSITYSGELKPAEKK
jgi:hypothetical protein